MQQPGPLLQICLYLASFEGSPAHPSRAAKVGKRTGDTRRGLSFEHGTIGVNCLGREAAAGFKSQVSSLKLAGNFNFQFIERN
jgi:hypothetical protein